MSPARQSHHAPVLMNAQRGGESAPTTAKMSFYDLQAKFWQLHEEANFTASETHLYFFLLSQFNAARWPAKLYRKRNQVAADAGLDFKTVDKTRAKLVARGLLTYDPGNKSVSATWALADGVPIEGKISPQSIVNSSQIEGNNSPAFGANKPDCSQIEGKISPPYKEEEEDSLTTTRKDQAAGAAGTGREDFEEVIAESPAAAPHTGGGATDVATSKPVGPRGWAYDPAAIADNLRLPFASAEFRAAWVRYRTYREEMSYRRLSGGLMEQQQLDSLAQLAAGSEANALLLIEQAIGAGWQKFYPLDKNYATARQSPSKRPAAGAGRVETLPTYGRNRGSQASPASGAA